MQVLYSLEREGDIDEFTIYHQKECCFTRRVVYTASSGTSVIVADHPQINPLRMAVYILGEDMFRRGLSHNHLCVENLINASKVLEEYNESTV